MSSEFEVLLHPCTRVFEEKRSRFICFLYPIENKLSLVTHVQSLRSLHPDASHVCSAYVVGCASQPLAQGYDDDGEPSGTAGKPMLNVLTQRGIGNCHALVVRYFGGTKLGAGGLVRAYGNAVSQCLDIAEFEVCYPSLALFLCFPYAYESTVRHWLGELNADVVDCDYTDQVTLGVKIKADQKRQLLEKLQNATSGQLRFQIR